MTACACVYFVQTRRERRYSSMQPSVPYRQDSPNFSNLTYFYPFVTFMAFAQETRPLVVSFRIKILHSQIYGLTFLTSRFHSVFCSHKSSIKIQPRKRNVPTTKCSFNKKEPAFVSRRITKLKAR